MGATVLPAVVPVDGGTVVVHGITVDVVLDVTVFDNIVVVAANEVVLRVVFSTLAVLNERSYAFGMNAAKDNMIETSSALSINLDKML